MNVVRNQIFINKKGYYTQRMSTYNLTSKSNY